MLRKTPATAPLAALALACALTACRPTRAPGAAATPAPGTPTTAAATTPVRRAPLASLDAHQVVPAPTSVVAGSGAPLAAVGWP